MLIANTQIFMFDPVDEREEIKQFEAANPDWEKNETIVCVSFSRTVYCKYSSKEKKDEEVDE